MPKKDLKAAFGEVTEEDLEFEKPPEIDLDEDGMKLVELEIPPESIYTIVKGWNKRHDGKKRIFHPNNETFDNLTKGFWEYALNTLNTVEILKVNLDKLPKELADLTRIRLFITKA